VRSLQAAHINDKIFHRARTDPYVGARDNRGQTLLPGPSTDTHVTVMDGSLSFCGFHGPHVRTKAGLGHRQLTGVGAVPSSVDARRWVPGPGAEDRSGGTYGSRAQIVILSVIIGTIWNRD
jgi:hypothetical protein